MEDEIKNKRTTSNYLTNSVGKKPSKKYSLHDDIREQKLYKANVKVRDKVARKYLSENYESSNASKIFPGQLVMFNYFEPKTKEDLKYYDAMPVTIFFGIHNTEQGKRVIGFNIHYYPPRMRYQIMERIFEIYKPFYLKSFNSPLKSELSHFDYKWLMEQLERAHLDFGVRQYIPGLCASVTPIPPESWAKAVFTEGHFKKETREQIMKYWRDLAQKQKNY